MPNMQINAYLADVTLLAMFAPELTCVVLASELGSLSLTMAPASSHYAGLQILIPSKKCGTRLCTNSVN